MHYFARRVDILEKEHADIASALTRGKDEVEANRRNSQARRRSSAGQVVGGAAGSLGTPLSDHEEVHSRIGVIEETLRMCDAEIRSIQEHLQLLPQLCELLNIPLSSIEETGTS